MRLRCQQLEGKRNHAAIDGSVDLDEIRGAKCELEHRSRPGDSEAARHASSGAAELESSSLQVNLDTGNVAQSRASARYRSAEGACSTRKQQRDCVIRDGDLDLRHAGADIELSSASRRAARSARPTGGDRISQRFRSATSGAARSRKPTTTRPFLERNARPGGRAGGNPRGDSTSGCQDACRLCARPCACSSSSRCSCLPCDLSRRGQDAAASSRRRGRNAHRAASRAAGEARSIESTVRFIEVATAPCRLRTLTRSPGSAPAMKSALPCDDAPHRAHRATARSRRAAAAQDWVRSSPADCLGPEASGSAQSAASPVESRYSRRMRQLAFVLLCGPADRGSARSADRQVGVEDVDLAVVADRRQVAAR